MSRPNFLDSVETELEIEFENSRKAQIILKSLKPEIVGSPSDRTSVKMKVFDRYLKITIHSLDSASLRASVNSYLRWLKLSDEILNLKTNTFQGKK